MTWDDVKKKYPGLYGGGLSRNDLTEEQEREFVDDCYQAYEHGGFAEKIVSPYECENLRNGMRFEVLGRVPEIKDDPNGVDLECLPMWRLRLENGDVMYAFPEEICLDERNK